jgi:hypothetical protein
MKNKQAKEHYSVAIILKMATELAETSILKWFFQK